MPSGLLSALGAAPVASVPTTVAPFLVPFLCSQHRAASILANLSDTPGAYHKKIRRGRGPSSGKGKTAGRGYNGQKVKSKVPRNFNGGQTPVEVSHGLRGFKNVFSEHMVSLNLGRLQSWVDQDRIDPSKPITIKELSDSRCAIGIKDGVKLLGGGSERLRSPLNIVVSKASATAIAAIENAGGSVTTRFYTPFSIQRILAGKTDPIHSLKSQLDEIEGEQRANRGFSYRLPDPTSRKDMEYYRDPAHRGYLSYQLADGQGPSLFFKTPGTTKFSQRKSGKRTVGGENRIF
ncbi:MAG: hypothetical protein Q9191_006495 [Dirinaria sp. TL-2023a]